MAAKFPELAARVRLFIARQPFAPFGIKTADGDTFHVPHPDFCMLSDTGETVEIHDYDDHVRVVNVRMIVSTEVARAKRGLLGQGGGKR